MVIERQDMTAVQYEKDFYAWAMWNAKALREGNLSEVDVEHVAEEIESMGKSEKRELYNRLVVLLAHLLKWQFQPDCRGKSWRLTISEQRRQIQFLLKESPSLQASLEDALQAAYPDSVRLALLETGFIDSPFPAECPYGMNEVLEEDYLPE